MIVVQLFRCLGDENTEHLFIWPFLLTQKSGAAAPLLSLARCFICFILFGCRCEIVSLFSAFHLLLWNVPFSDALLCASARFEGLVAEVHGQLIRWGHAGANTSSWAQSLCNKGGTAHQDNGKGRCRGGSSHWYRHRVMVWSALTF